MNQGDLLIVIPTYNEALSIPVLIPSIFGVLPNANILIIDDGSPDGTFEICQNLSSIDSRISVINRGEKLGLATAFVHGFKWGLQHNYEAIAEMDADGSHQPSDLLELVDTLIAAPHLQMVIGSRWISGGAIENWAWHRTVLSRFANKYAKAILALPVNDVTAGFRVFRREVLSRIDLESLQSKGFCFHIEMTNVVATLAVPIKEVPITFIERKHGSSKMSFEIAHESFLRVTLWGIQKRLGNLLPLA